MLVIDQSNNCPNNTDGNYIQITLHNYIYYFYHKVLEFTYERGEAAKSLNPFLYVDDKTITLPCNSNHINWKKHTHYYEKGYIDNIQLESDIKKGLIRISKQSLFEYQKDVEDTYERVQSLYFVLNKPINNKTFSHNEHIISLYHQKKKKEALFYIKNLLNGHTRVFHNYYYDYVIARYEGEYNTQRSYCHNHGKKDTYYAQEPIFWKPNSSSAGLIGKNIYPKEYKKDMKQKITKTHLREALISTKTLAFFVNSLVIEIKPPIISDKGTLFFSNSLYINNISYNDLGNYPDLFQKWRDLDPKIRKELFLLVKPDLFFKYDDDYSILVDHLIFIRSSRLGEINMFIINYVDKDKNRKRLFLKEFSIERAKVSAVFRLKKELDKIIKIELYKKVRK